MLRSLICAVVGHVDHGKTTLLDSLRETAVVNREPGAITQTISSTFIPKETIEKLSGDLLKKFGVKLTIPGLLAIDTPGHAAFTSMRQRGGTIADIAILLVDINEGLMPQTIESIEILKASKTPFVIAMNKIDRIYGWNTDNKNFLESFSKQNDNVKGDFEKKFYEIVKQFNAHDITVERFDRVTDFTKQIAAVPISAVDKIGISELLAVLAGLAERFMKERLESKEEARGAILEVKEMTGLGLTLDVILCDGMAERGDFIVVGGETPCMSKIKALLEPNPLQDMRAEKKFINIDCCRGAIGVKLVGNDLCNASAGSDFRIVKTEEEAKRVLEEFEEQKEDVEINKEAEGLVLRADTLGSLEAMLNVFEKYPVRQAKIGNISKDDVISAEANKQVINKIVIGFNVHIGEDASELARDNKIHLLTSDIIYRLIEDYEKWIEDTEKMLEREEISEINRPGKIKLLPGLIFRASNPAVVGCEILGGKVKPGSGLLKGGEEVGVVKQLQQEGENVDEVKIGDKAAISITGPTVGRQIKESDELYTNLTENDYKKLKKYTKLLSDSEKKIMEEIAEIKRKKNSFWGR